VDIVPLCIPGVKLLQPKRQNDNRGYFCEIFREEILRAGRFVQDNISFSAAAGTLRGLHFQAPPFAQAKLFMVLTGAVFDVAVDLRRGSPTFGRWAGAEITAEKFNQIFIPAGFAHGFLTLVPNTTIFYKVNAYYSAAHERGVLWNDPTIGVDWPIFGGKITTSEEDKRLPLLSEIVSPFTYEPKTSDTYDDQS
jgi:dTDP-4-dehydrorhamnose 3,5-epimerase